MFRRSPAAGVDAVAAARRRLAALAVQHSDEVLEATHADAAGEWAGSTPPGERVEDGPRHVARPSGLRPVELGRWGITGHHVTVVALGLVLAVALVAWWVLRSVPHTDQVALSTHRDLPASTISYPDPSTPLAPPGVTTAPGGGAQASAPGSTRLVVDVAGRVRHPGIVELPLGSRVVDAIAAAGGPRPRVSLTALNLARVLVDGEQIVVGVHAPGVVGSPGSMGGAPVGAPTTAIVRVQLNTATAEQLDTLPGVGPVTAQAILQWRADNGPFTSVDELLEVSGIGDATLADLRPYVYV